MLEINNKARTLYLNLIRCPCFFVAEILVCTNAHSSVIFILL